MKSPDLPEGMGKSQKSYKPHKPHKSHGTFRNSLK